MRHATRAIDLYEQGDIVFLVNREAGTHASAFTATHGPAIVGMGWKTTLAPGAAQDAAVARGAIVFCM